MIINLTIELKSFRLEDIIKFLKKVGLKNYSIKIEQSLERLEIAYILKKDKGTYSLQIPIMKEKTLETNHIGRSSLIEEDVSILLKKMSLWERFMNKFKESMTI